MMVDCGSATAVLMGGATLFVAVLAVIGKWRTLERASRVKLVRFFKRAPILMVVGGLYFGLFDHTPRGTRCRESISPDGLYRAERCLLEWAPGGESEHVGRLFDAKTGKKLAQHTFSTSVPEIAWYSYYDTYVSFSNGDGGDDSVYISLPPSNWDRLLAARPHL